MGAAPWDEWNGAVCRVTPEEAVRQRILDLSTIAGTRVFTLKLPQKLATWPAACVQLVRDMRDYHLRGGSRIGKAFMWVKLYAPEASGVDPYARVVQLAGEIAGDEAGSGLNGWIGEFGSPAFRITGAFLISRGDPTYEPGEGTGSDSGGELRIVLMPLYYRVHYRA